MCIRDSTEGAVLASVTDDPYFNEFIKQILEQNGDKLPVSKMRYVSETALVIPKPQYIKRRQVCALRNIRARARRIAPAGRNQVAFKPEKHFDLSGIALCKRVQDVYKRQAGKQAPPYAASLSSASVLRTLCRMGFHCGL